MPNQLHLSTGPRPDPTLAELLAEGMHAGCPQPGCTMRFSTADKTNADKALLALDVHPELVVARLIERGALIDFGTCLKFVPLGASEDR